MGALQGTFTGYYEDYHLGLLRVPYKGILLEWGSPFCFVKGLPWEAQRHGRNSRDFGSGFGGLGLGKSGLVAGLNRDAVGQ